MAPGEPRIAVPHGRCTELEAFLRQAMSGPAIRVRTCDAVGACLALPRFPWVPEALARGNTLRKPVCAHWTGDPLGWLARQRERGARIVGVELAGEAVRFNVAIAGSLALYKLSGLM